MLLCVYGLCVPARCNTAPSGSSRSQGTPRQRVAVEIVAAAEPGRLLAGGWLRHGDTADAALVRVLTGCGLSLDQAAAAARSMELGGVTSQVHDLQPAVSPAVSPAVGPTEDPAVRPAVRVHRVGLQFPLPDDGFGEQLLGAGRVGRGLVGRGLLATGLPDVGDVLADIDPGHPRHPSPHAGHPPDGDPIRIQRAACYAIVRDRVQDRGQDHGRVLLTRMRWSGRWALPGGGIDIGEHPDHALNREVLEETGFRLADVRLAGVSTAQWTGRAPDGVPENFHAVNLLYTGVAPPGTPPQVLEVDGSTEAVEWVDESELATLALTSAAVSGLALAGVGRR
jgi:ADP-ribose pyrophosphatase YjhB (NUDIX family)